MGIEQLEKQRNYLSSPESYWGNRLRHFDKVWGVDEADEKIQEAMKEDAAAWGIFAGI